MSIVKNALLKDFAYYGTGGPCDLLYKPATVQELAAYVKEAQRCGTALIPLGAGTNSLVMDEPFRGAFVVFAELDELRVEGDCLLAGAGIGNTQVAQLAHRQALAGAAWMHRLPGQLGGTVRMNARCYGGEISEVVREVTAVTRQGDVRVYREPGMFRGYKDTIFMENGDLIAAVRLQLKAGDPVAIAAAMQRCEDDRVAKGQFDFPSCGCVFKNDYSVGVPSGRLLEAAGAKGLSHGGAEVSPHHANFVFNKGAGSRAILELTVLMRELVYKEFGVWMAYEMEILGTVPKDLVGCVQEQRPAAPKRAKIAELCRA